MKVLMLFADGFEEVEAVADGRMYKMKKQMKAERKE